MIDHKTLALDVLSQLASGKLEGELFTDDAQWWSNTGHSFPLQEFQRILGKLHQATVNGIRIDTGLVLSGDSHVMVEATSNIPLVDGRTYANRYIFLFEFRNGLVSVVKEYNDTSHVAESFDLASII